MTSPLAVVVSTYNAPQFLRLTLEGYRQQSDLNFKIYIADDGSTDETRELIGSLQEDFPVPVEHVWHADHGFRKARIHNLTIDRIREPQVLLTDGDCVPLPGLVAAHRRYAAPDGLISGSRVLLSKDYTARLCEGSEQIFPAGPATWLRRRLTGKVNRLLPMLLPTALGAPTTQLEGIRGCHLACPREALVRVNGFDESYEGWGREDSDLTARLLHAGLVRRNLRGTAVLHLWHPDFSRQSLERNDARLRACIDEHRIEAITGLQQLGQTGPEEEMNRERV